MSSTVAEPGRATPYADESRVAAWDRRVDWWLTGLALLFCRVRVVGAGPGARSDRPGRLEWCSRHLGAVRAGLPDPLWLAERKLRFVLRHLPDLAILLLPMFRQLRVLRLVTVISVLNRQLRDDVRGRVVLYVASTVTLVGFVAALAVLDAERQAPDASITTFGDAVWWTLTTISTVGYGDRYPVTLEGRFVAAALMVAGIALLGVVTASIASWFVENLRRAGEEVAEDVEEVAEDVERSSAMVEVQLAAMLTELRTLNARLGALERGASEWDRHR